MIKELYELVTEIQNTSGTNDKKAILSREKGNEEFKQFLKYVLDPMMVYGIQDKKLNKMNVNSTTKLLTLFDVFEYLLEHNTGRDEDAVLVKSFINSQDEQYHDFLVKSFTKKLKLGINVKSINSVYPGLINSFGVMLAKKYYDEQSKVEGKEFYLTEKYDGVRCVAIKSNGKVSFFSRQGQPILELIDIENEMKQLPDDLVLDGELLIKDYDQFKDRDVLQQTLKIVRKDGVKTGVNYMVFDWLPLDEFNSGKSKLTYAKRQELHPLNYINFNNICKVPILYKGKDMSIVPELLGQLEDEGKEGLMLNLANGYWTNTRSSSLLKIKTMQTFDERVIDVFEGEGKYKGMLGGVIVNYKDNTLHVGSGFNDEQRKYYWKHPDEIVGRVIEIQYFRESVNQNGTYSVSFPIFKAVRELGKEPSYY